MESEIYDVLIIGCGAVGAAVSREFTLLGQKCIVLEKNQDVLSEASSGNTGHLVRNLTRNQISDIYFEKGFYGKWTNGPKL